MRYHGTVQLGMTTPKTSPELAAMREELSDIILDVGEYIPGSHADDYVNPYKAADAILAAGYRKVGAGE